MSATNESIESQRCAMQRDGIAFEPEKEFKDEGVSGSVPAKDRPGFAKLLEYVRKGDTLHVYAVDRLGRDARDVRATVRDLIQRGVTVNVHGLGQIGAGAGELILAVFAQVADMERNRIKERTEAGRDRARAEGKHLGRPASIDGERAVAALNSLAAGGIVAGVARDFGITRQALIRLRDGDGKHAIKARKLAAWQ